MRTSDQLADLITSHAAHLDAALCDWLDLVAEFDDRSCWQEFGAKSCAHWLSWMCSIGANAAREHVRVARRLRELPLVREAFASGGISYSKVRAITRVEDIELEPELLELAQNATASQLERIVRGYRGVVATEAGHARAHENRHFEFWHDDDGALILRGRLPAEEGALLLAAMDAARDGLFVAARKEDDTEVEITHADVLLEVADRAIAGDASRRTGGDRYQVVVHADAAALPSAAPPAVGTLDSGIPLPAETVRRLSCDCSRVEMTEDADGNVLSVGRKTRTIPPPIRRAMQRRDGGCRFPGCGQSRHVDGHHIKHWTDGGETRLDNLTSLCRFHHRLLHEEGFGLRVRADGELVFTDPHGRQLRQVPRRRRGCAEEVARGNQRRGVEPELCRPCGDPLDLEAAVEVMARIATPAETRFRGNA